jgi:hypothetical protein
MSEPTGNYSPVCRELPQISHKVTEAVAQFAKSVLTTTPLREFGYRFMQIVDSTRTST